MFFHLCALSHCITSHPLLLCSKFFIHCNSFIHTYAQGMCAYYVCMVSVPNGLDCSDMCPKAPYIPIKIHQAYNTSLMFLVHDLGMAPQATQTRFFSHSAYNLVVPLHRISNYKHVVCISYLNNPKIVHICQLSKGAWSHMTYCNTLIFNSQEVCSTYPFLRLLINYIL